MLGFSSGPGKLKRNPSQRNQTFSEVCDDDDDDDDVCSNIGRDDELECPICCESFNLVENIPYVLWCGHTLCRNCVFGLERFSVRFPFQRIRVPFLVSCPWCTCLSGRLVYKGNLKFPRKNFFLLWLVEGCNVQRRLTLGRSSGERNIVEREAQRSFSEEQQVFQNDDLVYGGRRTTTTTTTGGLHPVNRFIRFTRKFPLMAVLLLIIFLVIPACSFVLVMYFLFTALVAAPSVLVLYLAYPVLDWLIRSITA